MGGVTPWPPIGRTKNRSGGGGNLDPKTGPSETAWHANQACSYGPPGIVPGRENVGDHFKLYIASGEPVGIILSPCEHGSKMAVFDQTRFWLEGAFT